ncbi:helix-turn-helix domain-containing protein [Streptomyces sp. NPDC056527]|uniref:helix-turn-helix domain-containing protein n=1 Tax=Streptomyces sp. NPDC056527 TaxID=3345853 RepID=UPI0036B0765B
MNRLAWSAVPKPLVEQFTASALAESASLAEAILHDIRDNFPQLHLVEDESGAPKALLGIQSALEGFVLHLVSGTTAPRLPSGVFQEFGKAEGLSGRSLDLLQAVYRLGVRLAWRRFAEIGQQIDIAAPAMYELVEAGFTYLDGLVEQSVRGYAEAMARQESERLQLQRALIDGLLSGHHSDPATALAALSTRIEWEMPSTVAVGLLLRPTREAVTPALGQGILLDMESEQPRILIPAPDEAGRADHVRRAVVGWSGMIGPTVPLADAQASLRWAESGVQLIQDGLLPRGEVQRCTDHTEELILLPSCDLIDAAALRLLAPLSEVGATQARHLAVTLLAWIETSGSATDIADQLGIHPQTARYRLRQLRELWGDSLNDPDQRFEMLLVLRSQRLRGTLFGGE